MVVSQKRAVRSKVIEIGVGKKIVFTQAVVQCQFFPSAVFGPAAIEAGLQTLRMDGARKVVAGVTTISEVLRVAQADVI